MKPLIVLFSLLATPLAAQHMHHGHGAGTSALSEGGQAAFAALSEVLARLDADPATDWSSVNLPALRDHLRDMNDVFLFSRIDQQNTEAGATFTVTGDSDRVTAAIRRMAHAHATTVAPPMRFEVTDVDRGVRVTVQAPQDQVARLQAIGFLGLLADGDHHRMHHWAIASGQDPHHP